MSLIAEHLRYIPVVNISISDMSSLLLSTMKSPEGVTSLSCLSAGKSVVCPIYHIHEGQKESVEGMCFLEADVGSCRLTWARAVCSHFWLFVCVLPAAFLLLTSACFKATYQNCESRLEQHHANPYFGDNS